METLYPLAVLAAGFATIDDKMGDVYLQQSFQGLTQRFEDLIATKVCRRNERFKDRYRLAGTTLGGRRLTIIFQLKPGNVVRIITGWPL